MGTGEGVLVWGGCTPVGRVYSCGEGVLVWGGCTRVGRVYSCGEGVLMWGGCTRCVGKLPGVAEMVVMGVW